METKIMKRLSVELKNVSLIFCQYRIRLFIWPVWKVFINVTAHNRGHDRGKESGNDP